MSKQLEIGQRVEAIIQRTGGKRFKVIGKVIGFSNDFGRDEVEVGGGKIESFTVSRVNVKPIETEPTKTKNTSKS